jgi:hypothetical protein
LGGAKALLKAVLELGMPYTLERDDVLHGFLYGSESLADREVSLAFVRAGHDRLQADYTAKPVLLAEVAPRRAALFFERLDACLDDLETSGEAETPRLVGHTLRLLNLLREAWTEPANSPPPALELGWETDALRLVLYGEPYVDYTLQFQDSLGSSSWSSTTTTDLRSEEEVIIDRNSSEPVGFYRALLPTP